MVYIPSQIPPFREPQPGDNVPIPLENPDKEKPIPLPAPKDK